MMLASSQRMKVGQELTEDFTAQLPRRRHPCETGESFEKNCTHLVGATPSDGASKLDRQIQTLILIVTHPKGHGQGKVPYFARNF